MADFEPTGIFSFEFQDRLLPFISSEIVLLIPPDSVQVQYGYRLKVHKTIGGSHFDYFRPDNPQFTISGSLWSPWIDILPSPFGSGVGLQSAVRGGVSSLAGAASNLAQGLFPTNQMSGLDEFFRLKYSFLDFFNPDTSLVIPSSLDSFGPLPGLKLLGIYALIDRNNLTDMRMIYHDYDDDVHWEVVPQEDGFMVSKEKADPFTVNWTIKLTGIRDTRIFPFLVPSLSKKVNTDAYLEQISAIGDTLNPLDAVSEQFSELAASISDIRSISSGGKKKEDYEVAKKIYFDKKKPNANDVILKSEDFSETADSGANGLVDLILETAGLDPELYNIYSEDPNPPECVIASGQDPIFNELAKIIETSTVLSNINGFKGEPLTTEKANEGKNVKDLPPITEELFSANESLANSITYTPNKWRTYVVNIGDNLGSIASNQLGDYSRFPEIARLNKLKMSDFLLDGQRGQTIKLPERTQTIYNNPRNLVYFKNRENYSSVGKKVAQEEILGRDIPLSSTRGMIADHSGDLPVSSPQDGFVDNLVDLMNFPKGTLTLYPEWGHNLEPGIQNNLTEKVIKIKIRNVLRIDPRVQDINIDNTDVVIDGDAIKLNNIRVTPLTGEPTTINR